MSSRGVLRGYKTQQYQSHSSLIMVTSRNKAEKPDYGSKIFYQQDITILHETMLTVVFISKYSMFIGQIKIPNLYKSVGKVGTYHTLCFQGSEKRQICKLLYIFHQKGILGKHNLLHASPALRILIFKTWD